MPDHATPSPDFSAVPPMPDGRAADEHIAEVAGRSEAVRVPMGNGGRMMWHVWGGNSGRPPLVLFHGGSGSWIHWIRNVEALARDFTVYAADLPGLGDSDPPDDVRDVWSVTRCVKTAMDQLLPRDRRYDICGFSFGGMVGGHVSTLLDERLRSVTLVGPGGFRLRREPRGALVKLTRDMGPERLAAEARRNLELLMVHDPASIDGVAIHMQMLNTMRAKTKSRVMSAAGVLSDVLPRITTRLNAIWGEFDSTAYPHYAERETLLRGHQPDIDLRYIAGGGHWVAYEKAGEFNAMLPDMLGRMPP
ncbi:MAG: alpha/beta hydrolase [Rhodospirillales bacterium]|nr:MAG: alpha/beta hydrolase [Rhodospirillales bacterium]